MIGDVIFIGIVVFFIVGLMISLSLRKIAKAIADKQ